jgi:predicted RNA-binding protein with PUA-like domain
MQYWIMKSEPDVFSIDDLAKRPNQTEPWNGVRNYQVRNWIRDEMKIHDHAFFYHSSCKIPGIAGIIKIVSKAYPDTTALDPASEYYDPDSTQQNPRWFCIDVKLIRQFKKIISLAELKEKNQLKDMRLLQKGNRLSITPISESDWKIILSME